MTTQPDQRLRLRWFITSQLRDTVRADGTNIIGDWTAPEVQEMNVVLETYDPVDEEWIEHPSGTTTSFGEDQDWEDGAPYAAARERLLAAAGLTEADLTDNDAECW